MAFFRTLTYRHSIITLSGGYLWHWAGLAKLIKLLVASSCTLRRRKNRWVLFDFLKDDLFSISIQSLLLDPLIQLLEVILGESLIIDEFLDFIINIEL